MGGAEKMAQLFLSFIVPVYNAARYLPECLDSMLNQDISPAEYEIICVNDGSRDESPEILHTYAQRHSNVVVIDKENGGVTTARNAGLEAARGDYIWFVDADDFLKENILVSLRRQLSAGGEDRLIVGSYTFEDVLSQEERNLAANNQLPSNGPGQDSIVWRSLFRREFLQKNGLYFSHPELTHGEDGLFMYEVCGFNPSCIQIPEAVYFYRVHSGSADTAASAAGLRKKLRSYIRITQILQEYYLGGRQDAPTANAYMTFLWFSLLTTASLPPKESREARKELGRLGLFPGKRLPQCTLTRSYMTDREDLVGKLYDSLYLHLHRPWGYAGIYLIRQLLRLKRGG